MTVRAGSLSIQPLEGSRSRLRQTRRALWALHFVMVGPETNCRGCESIFDAYQIGRHVGTGAQSRFFDRSHAHRE